MDLVIDDQPHERVTPLYNHGLEVHVWVESSLAAIRQLTIHAIEGEVFDRIWFDYDLGHGDDTVFVAEYLEILIAAGLSPDLIPECIIHTQNVVGRENLERVFSRWKIAHRHIHFQA